MEFFNKKQLKKTEDVGGKLKQLRKNAGLSRKELENITKLSRDYIEAIESSSFQRLPEGDIYKKLFVKRYLSPFNVDAKDYLSQLQKNKLGSTKEEVVFSKQKTNKWSLGNFPLFIKITTIVSIIVLLVGYIGFQVKQVLDPPMLKITSPAESHTTHKENITIKGKTNKEVIVSINGKKVGHDKSGFFKKNLDLKKGLNTIVIKAKKKHGKTTTVVRHIVLKQQLSSL